MENMTEKQTLPHTTIDSFLAEVRRWRDEMCNFNTDKMVAELVCGIEHPIGWRPEYNVFRRKSDGKLFRMHRGAEEKRGYYSVEDASARVDTGEFIPWPIENLPAFHKAFDADFERGGPTKSWSWTAPYRTAWGMISGNAIKDPLRHFESVLVGRAFAEWLISHPDEIVAWCKQQFVFDETRPHYLQNFMFRFTPAICNTGLPDCGGLSGTLYNLVMALHDKPYVAFAY